jgi:hypothetical protein
MIVTLPDDLTLYEAAQHAQASHLHLVIDRDGEVKLTPVLFPGMQKIAVKEKPAATLEEKAA